MAIAFCKFCCEFVIKEGKWLVFGPQNLLGSNNTLEALHDPPIPRVGSFLLPFAVFALDDILIKMSTFIGFLWPGRLKVVIPSTRATGARGLDIVALMLRYCW